MKSVLPLTLGPALVLPLHADENAQAGKQEARPAVAKLFKKKDKDGDNFLSNEEFPADAKNAAETWQLGENPRGWELRSPSFCFGFDRRDHPRCPGLLSAQSESDLTIVTSRI